MTFRFERDMAGPVQDWLENQGLMIKPEFVTPWGICDFVGVSFNEEHVRCRRQNRQLNAIGPAFRVGILTRIPDEDTDTSITLRRLEREFQHRFTPDELRSELAYLERYNFIQSPKRGHFQKLNGWMPLQNRIVAVEAKLTRIEEVLFQARNHLKFASESYIALPSDGAERLARTKRFDYVRNAGIGLLSVRSENCRVLLKPNPSKDKIDAVLQMHCVERFWRAYARDSEA